MDITIESSRHTDIALKGILKTRYLSSFYRSGNIRTNEVEVTCIVAELLSLWSLNSSDEYRQMP